MMTSNKLLITGVNGRIGRILEGPLIETISISGCDLTGPFSSLFLQLDIRGENQVEAFFEKHEPFPWIIHFAADPRLEASWEEVLDHNIRRTRNLYHAARQHRTR